MKMLNKKLHDLTGNLAFFGQFFGFEKLFGRSRSASLYSGGCAVTDRDLLELQCIFVLIALIFILSAFTFSLKTGIFVLNALTYMLNAFTFVLSAFLLKKALQDSHVIASKL